MIIRAATHTELPKFLPLLHEMHETSGLVLPDYDDEKVVASLEACADNGVVLGAYDGDSSPKGVLALAEGEHWFSREKFLGDLVFYVAQEKRASTAAKRLLTTAKKYAIIKARPLLMAVVDGNDVERKDRFYERTGFRRIGGVFMFDPKVH